MSDYDAEPLKVDEAKIMVSNGDAAAAGAALCEAAFGTLKEFAKAAPEQPVPARDTFTKEELTAHTTRIVTTIGLQQDFNFGVKRDRLEDIFRQAADRGPAAVAQLANSVNERLRPLGLELRGTYNVRTSTVDEADHSHSRLLVMPAWVRYGHAWANFHLYNTNTKETEDNLSVTGRQLSREPVPNIESSKKKK